MRERITRLVAEHLAIAPYDPRWPHVFQQERQHLLACLPDAIVKRVEHFGSTAIPGLAAKPIVDILVEVADLGETRRRIVPILEAQGYNAPRSERKGNATPVAEALSRYNAGTAGAAFTGVRCT